jgi:hypothetical protein
MAEKGWHGRNSFLFPPLERETKSLRMGRIREKAESSKLKGNSSLVYS